jgi:inosine/xanthosine triphosphate pyrophosphatase family protein
MPQSLSNDKPLPIFLIATTNSGKIREFRQMLAPHSGIFQFSTP